MGRAVEDRANGIRFKDAQETGRNGSATAENPEERDGHIPLEGGSTDATEAPGRPGQNEGVIREGSCRTGCGGNHKSCGTVQAGSKSCFAGSRRIERSVHCNAISSSVVAFANQPFRAIHQYCYIAGRRFYYHIQHKLQLACHTDFSEIRLNF